MKLYLDEWLAVIGAAILVAGLAVLGAYQGLDLKPAADDGRAVVLEGERLGSHAHTFFFSASSNYTIAFWVLVGVLAGMTVAYVVAGLTHRREPARVETLRPAEEVESRRKAA
jgi:ABC-type Fe3+-siderophore transport system permease subunit